MLEELQKKDGEPVGQEFVDAVVTAYNKNLGLEEVNSADS